MLHFTLRALMVGGLLCAAVAGSAKPLNEPPATENPSLEFVENKGQWDAPARYGAALPGGRLLLTPAGFRYSFFDPAALKAHAHHGGEGPAGKPAPDELKGHNYSVTFEGANPTPGLSAENITPAPYNFFKGADPKRWASNARGYRRVRYTGLYPGIDAVLYENTGQHLEYDFVVQPGSRPAAIRLRYTGPDKLSLSPDGSLLVQTSVGTITEQAPKAWQDIRGQRVAVPCAFVLQGELVSFQLGKYDRRHPLTIDPTVLFSSFTGSTADNWGYTATYDAQGNMYSGGIVLDVLSGQSFPTSTGAFQTSYGGNTDVAIIKYNTQVSGPAARLYATYLGGNSMECPHSMIVNPQGELVILGTTGSSNFPTTSGAYDNSHNGGPAITPDGSASLRYANGSDLFVTKLSANGSTLTGSTFLGGAGTDGVLEGDRLAGSSVTNYGDQFRGDITTDGDGNVYIASATASLNFPTPNGYRTAYQGGASDGVVAKLSANLRSLLWATYLGGASSDAAYSLQVDASRGVYVSGGTTSTNFPTSGGSLNATYRGATDGFVTHLSNTGTAVLQSSYVGTNAYDQAFFVQLDAASNVYLLGQTQGALPITPGCYGVQNGRQFIQKLDPTLSTSFYSTRFGSGNTLAPDISLTAFLVDDCERIYISGWGGVVNTQTTGFTSSTNGLPVTPNAIQTQTDGSDFYIAQFRPGMQSIEYATFYGERGGQSGEHVDGGTSRFDKRGIIYQAVCGGCRGSSAFPVPPGANTYSTTNKSTNCNNAAFKIDFGITVADPGPSRYVCVNTAPITLGGSPAGGTWTGPGVTALPGGGYQFTPSPARLGVNTLTYSVASTGTCVSTRPLRVTVTPERPLTIAPVPNLCVNSNAVLMAASPAGGSWSGPGMTGASFSPTAAGIGTHTLTYSMSDTLGCGLATQLVTVVALPTVKAGRDTTLCADQTRPFQLLGASPAGGSWSGQGVSADGLFTPPNTNNRGGIFTLRYTYTQNGCANSATRTVLLAPTSASNVALSIPVCAAAPQYTGLAPFTCQFEPILLGGTYDWDFGDGSPHSTETSPAHLYERAGTYNVKLVARYAGCVVETRFAPVEIGEVFVPNIITPNGDSLNDSFRPRFSCKPARLQIFDRWGAIVYETQDYHNNWNGTRLPDGVYYYLLRDADNRRAKGWVEVRR